MNEWEDFARPNKNNFNKFKFIKLSIRQSKIKKVIPSANCRGTHSTASKDCPMWLLENKVHRITSCSYVVLFQVECIVCLHCYNFPYTGSSRSHSGCRISSTILHQHQRYTYVDNIFCQQCSQKARGGWVKGFQHKMMERSVIAEADGIAAVHGDKVFAEEITMQEVAGLSPRD